MPSNTAGSSRLLLLAAALFVPVLAQAGLPRPVAQRHVALHHGDGDWLAKLPELAAIEDPLARRKALRSWVEYLHRTEATQMTDAELVEAMPHLPPASRTALVFLNLHRLAGDLEGQAALEPWIDPAAYPGLVESLGDADLVPAALGWAPDIDDLEEEFDFFREELKPLAVSALAGFLEGRFTPRQLEYYMGMQNSAHGRLGRRIAARVIAVDPMLRGLEATCEFRAEPVHPQAKIIFFKYLVGDVRTGTFRSWFRMAGDPALTDCLVGELDPQ